MGLGILLACTLAVSQMVVAEGAQAAPVVPVQEAPAAGESAPAEQIEATDLPGPIADVPAVDPGPDAGVGVVQEANKATQQIGPLPALGPEPGRPGVPIAPVTPAPPVQPSPLDLPTRPAQELIDATATDALATIAAAGYAPDGVPNLDATQLQPQVAGPQVVDDTRPATLQELIDALLSGNLPPDLGIDPLAILEQLPDGLPRITYRVCSESATKAVSCSLTLPLAVPAVVDVTGDGTPDVLADLLPAVAPGDIVGAAEALLDALALLDETRTRLTDLIELIQDPLWLLLNPWALLERLRLEELVTSLTEDVADLLDALLDLVHLGLAFLEVRLPTSELAGQDLPGHVWAVYDVPGGNRLSVGYDGFRRGTSLSTATLGLFTFAPLDAITGQYDIRASLVNAGAGDAMAVTAGLARVADTDAGEAVDPTVASARFSPVPTVFSAHAAVRPAAGDDEQRAEVDAVSNVRTHLDTIVMANGGGSDRFVQADVGLLPTTVSAELTWTPGGDHAVLDYDASAPIDDLLFADYTYTTADTALIQATQARAAGVPATVDADLATAADNSVELDYTASSSLESLDVNYYDAGGEIVLRGGLDAVPTALTLRADPAAGRVLFAGEQALGQATVAASLHLGDYAPLGGDHATLLTTDTATAVSAQVTGMQTVDAYFDGHPRLRTVFDPGGQAFDGAGRLAGGHEASLHISNLPAEASLDVDTAAQELTYEATDVVDLARVAYTNTAGGPTIHAGVHGLPQRVHLTYELGDRPQVTYEASADVPLVEMFASLDHVATLRPQEDHYLSTAISDIPATLDVLIDFPARHLEGEMSGALGGIDVVARFPLEGRDWTAMADLGGVPASFDADWAGGTVRMRGISGPLASVDLAAFNHPAPTAPQGLRLAAHFRESTGDLDAAVATRNLSHVEYSKSDEGQNFRLDTDTQGEPVFVDVDVLLADPQDASVDDTQLAVLGRVDNLPSTLDVTFTGGKLRYAADRNIGLSLEARVGKVAALDGLGAPLFDNGVAAVARTCAEAPGCATDETPFCLEAGCVGLVGTINLPGLPAEVVVDTAAGTVSFADYQPPAAPLQAFVRLVGIIDSLPDLRAQATLSGLPSPLDFTLGPVEVGGSRVDVGYTASAPLGDLQLDADVRTTDEQYPVVRARASVTGLPQTLALSGEFGPETTVGIHNSAAIPALGLTVTSDDEGYIRASVTDVPADVDAIVDVPASHLEGTMSAPLGGIEVLAQNMPFQGDTWGAYVNLAQVPAGFDADWSDGGFRFRGLSGPLGTAHAAVTNHPGAMAPVGPHLAAHFRESTGDVDGSASISGVSLAEYSSTGGDLTVDFDAASQSIALDGDVVLAAGGADDTRFGALGVIGPIPSEMSLTAADGVVTYAADRALDVTLQLWLGKVAALATVGAPLLENGISIVDAGCGAGAGCASDEGPFCLDGGCFGATGIVNVSGLPAAVTIDSAAGKYSFRDYDPVVDRLQFYAEDEVFVPAPLTAAKALVTLSGLPQGVDFTLGPVTTGEAIDVGYTSDVESAGRVEVHAEADGVPVLGNVRARAVADPIPGSLQVTGRFGAHSEVSVENSTAIDELSLVASGTFEGEPATGGIVFTDIPRSFTITSDMATAGVTVPEFTYAASADTLDGLFGVDGQLAFNTGPVDTTVSTTYLDVDDLGRDTSVTMAEDGSVQITSDPSTPRIEFHTGLAVTGMPGATVDEDFGSKSFAGIEFTARLQGSWGFEDSSIGDLSFAITDLESLTMRPAVIPLNSDAIPEGLGWLFPGFDHGAYGAVTMGAAQVDLRPDIDLTFRIDRNIGPDLFNERVVIQPGNSIVFHRYDQEVREVSAAFQGSIGGADIVCAHVFTRPGRLDTGENRIVVHSQTGQQMVNFLDVNGAIPDYAIDLLAHVASPFPDAYLDWSLDPISCG